MSSKIKQELIFVYQKWYPYLIKIPNLSDYSQKYNFIKKFDLKNLTLQIPN